MLVLARKASQAIHIGDDIVIEIVKIEGSRVRVAISAPDHVKILRGELLEREPRKMLDTTEGDGVQ